MKPLTPHKPPEDEAPKADRKKPPERPLEPPAADDDSVAGEEDPGSAADVLRRGPAADQR